MTDPLIAALRLRRQTTKRSIEAVAQLAGVLPKTLAGVELGRQSPTLRTLRALCDVLGVDLVLVPKPERTVA